MTQKTQKSGAKKSAISATAKSTAARLAAVQAVYQMAGNDQKAEDVISEYIAHRLGKTVDDNEMILPDGNIFRTIVSGVQDNRETLDEVIDNILKKRSSGEEGQKGQTPDMLLNAIFLCGACEMLVHPSIDGPIIISDYLHVTDAFYEGGEKKLVNAVLDKAMRSFRDM